MSPEQALGKPADNRSDIYSLGVVLYQLATSRLPFSGETPSDTLNRILNSQPDAIARFNYNIDPELERIIRKCMEKDPERRYQSARELLIDLKNLKRDSESGASQMGARAGLKPVPTKQNWKLFAGIAAVAVAVAAGIFYYARADRGNDIRSLAVLPFANVNGNPNEEWLSDGITENTINSLSQLPELKVMARSTVFRYKNQNLDPQRIGKDLNVDAVLTGTMNQKGDNLIVNAELVNVRDGSQIWGHQYNQKTSDIMQVQKDLSEDISEKLRSRLTGEQMEKVAKNYTENADAYQLYMKGRYYWNKRTDEGIKKGIEYFQQAIEKDPSYALAYSGLADSYGVDTSPFPIEERNIKSKAAAKKALEIDDSLAEAHASLATSLQMERDWLGSDQQLKRALELNPNYATARQWYAENLLVLGKVEKSIAQIKKAQELDPFSLIINATFGWVLYHARHFDPAIEQYKKTLEMDSRFEPVFGGLKDCYVAKKMYPQLIDLVEEWTRREGISSEQQGDISRNPKGLSERRRNRILEKSVGDIKERLGKWARFYERYGGHLYETGR